MLDDPIEGPDGLEKLKSTSKSKFRLPVEVEIELRSKPILSFD